MSLNLNRPTTSLASCEMLFIGFEGNFDANILDYPYQNQAYYFEIINDPGSAMRWLECRVERLETYQLPYAVFCSYQWLLRNNFSFLHQIKTHPDLRFVPIVMLARQGEVVDKEILIENGADDCYTMPVNWQQLEYRLDFLNQYKSRLMEQPRQPQPEQFQFRIPRIKRIFDIVGASLGIVLTSVIWLPVAIAIYLESRGPVIYRSKRVGAGYQIFDFLKFRSMCSDAEEHLLALQHLNVYGRSGQDAVFVKYVHDPRITRIGRFIRKYSIDELPQLINVLRGEMSLVGNRPLPIYEAEMLTRDEWSDRFLAPAGLTGLWQVTKRGHADMSDEERIALDIAYARNHNIWLDVKIIMRTFRAIVQKEDV